MTTKSPLTPRQIEVIQLIAAGESSKQIAGAMDISVGTVKAHRSQILLRLKSRNMANAVSRWVKQG